MNNYKITFSDLKKVSEQIQRGNLQFFVDYLNSFEGENTYFKFKNILKAWEFDVSYTLTLNVNDTPTKVQLSYINSQFHNTVDDCEIKDGDISMVIGIPTHFELTDFIPVYNILRFIEIYGISINLINLPFDDKQAVINNLPPQVFNIITNNILHNKNNIFELDNPMLDKFKINFLSNDPLLFLQGLFSNFNELYFRDTIYHISKKIDGGILLGSTPLEIEYYAELLAKDTSQQNTNLSI